MKGFGSDGFRGIIGHGFTRDTLARIAAGAAGFLNSQHPTARAGPIPVGYDTRFLSREAALYFIRLLEREGLQAQLADCPCPSPYLAFATRCLDAPLGIQVTASHNPWYYNGVKLKGSHGGSLLPHDVALIEQFADAADIAQYGDVEFIGSYSADSFNVTKKYWQALAEASGNQRIKDQNLVIDYLHGATARIYRELLQDRYSVNTELRLEADPLFDGGKPEPAPKNLEELRARVKFNGHNSIGLAFDGDGDRLAVVDESGRMLESHEIFCLLLEHVATGLGHRGPVVRTVSFSSLVDRVAGRLGCRVVEVPVGYKHVSEAMLNHQAVIGGEESGGTGFGHYLPERDALLMAMLLLDARSHAQTTLVEMVEHLYKRFGRLEFIRRDIRLPLGTDLQGLREQVERLAEVQQLGSDKVDKVSRLDGIKLHTSSGWVLVRPSGTEPLLRIYAEAQTVEAAVAYAGQIAVRLGLELPEPD